MKCKPIALNYLKGWFTLDAISTFPFQLIELYANTSNGSYNKLLRLLRLPRLYRLVRLFKCVRLIQMPGVKKCCQILRINQGLKRLLVVAALVLFFSHLISCLWYMVAKIDDFSSNTWVIRNGIQHETTAFKYLMSFYWTIQTITTVGFGDIGSRTSLEILLSLIWMIFGVGFYSYVIGNFSSIIASIDQKNKELKSRLELLDKFQTDEKISNGLYRRIKKYIELNIKHIDYLKMKQVLLEELPPALKIEVMFHTHGTMIKALHFYEDKIWNFIWMSLPKMQLKSFTKFEVLYKEEDVATECYFIMKGCVTLSTNDCRAFRKFFAGAHFGEFSVFQNIFRTETALTETNSEIYIMINTDFLELMEQFPIEARQLKRQATDKQNVLMREKAEILKNDEARADPRIIKALQNYRISQSLKRYSTNLDSGYFSNFNSQDSKLDERSVKNPRFRNDNRSMISHLSTFKSKCKTLPPLGFKEMEQKEEAARENFSFLFRNPEQIPIQTPRKQNNTGRSSQASYSSQIRDRVLSLPKEEQNQEDELMRENSLPRTKDSSIQRYMRPELDRFLLQNQSTAKTSTQTTQFSKKSTFHAKSEQEKNVSKVEKQSRKSEDFDSSQSPLVSVIRQFNQSIQILQKGSYEIFSALNAMQREQNLRNASINQKLDGLLGYQKELNEKLLEQE